MAGYSSHLPAMEEEEGAEPPLVARAAGSDALESLSHTSMRCGGCGAKVRVRVGANPNPIPNHNHNHNPYPNPSPNSNPNLTEVGATVLSRVMARLQESG